MSVTKFNCVSILHIPIVHTHDVSKQIPWEKIFPSGGKCYKTIGSYVSCVFIEIWSTWEVWRALKKLELLKATPRATLTHLSCSPNFPCASYLDQCTLTYEPIVKSTVEQHFTVHVLLSSDCYEMDMHEAKSLMVWLVIVMHVQCISCHLFFLLYLLVTCNWQLNSLNLVGYSV